MENNKIELKNVYKSYDGENYSVKDFNLSINDGEFIVFVGPSGCGKTTTLRMIAGLEDITKGDLIIDGKQMNDVSPQDRDLAMVFQNYALYPHMTIYENIAYPLKLRKIDKNEIDKSVKDAAEILGITHLLEKKPSMLSGGEKQRVALGRCIVRHPHAFLMDEPLSNLDFKLRLKMRTEISNLQSKLHKTFIYVTHDQAEALTMGDKIVVMKKGEILQVGNGDEIYNNPNCKFVADFIGSAPTNFIKVDGDLTVGDYTYKFAHPKPFYMSFRPEKASQYEKDGFKFYLTLTSIENLGSEQYLYGSLLGNSIVIKDFENKDYKVGETYTFYVDKNDLLFFDFETEKRVENEMTL